MHLAQKIRTLMICLGFILTGCGIFTPQSGYIAPIAEVPTKPVVRKLPPLKIETKNAQAAYVAEGNGHLFLCVIDNTGRVSNCKITGTTEQGIKPAWLPNYVTVNMNNRINYAYVASAEKVFVCNIAPDKNLTNCHSTGSSKSSGVKVKWLPTNIQFILESATTTAYITGVGAVYKCSVDNMGGLTNCSSTGESNLGKRMHWLPNGIMFNRNGQNTYAYVAASNKMVYQCLVNNNANLINCAKTGVTAAKINMSWHPNDIVFTAQGSGFYAYVATPYNIYACNVDPDGGLLNCTTTGSSKDKTALNWLPNTLAFNNTPSGKLAYVVGVYNVFLCDAQSNGMLTNCRSGTSDVQGNEMTWNPKKYLFNPKLD